MFRRLILVLPFLTWSLSSGATESSYPTTRPIIRFQKELEEGQRIVQMRLPSTFINDRGDPVPYEYHSLIYHPGAGRPVQTIEQSSIWPDFAHIPWPEYVSVACNGKMAAAVFNLHGFSWATAWQVKEDGSWQGVVYRVLNKEGKSSEGSVAKDAKIQLNEDHSIAVTIDYRNGDHDRFQLAPEDFRLAPWPPKYPPHASTMISPWKKLPEE